MSTSIPSWCAPYIGLPYLDKGRDRAGADCWGGVRLALQEVFGFALPDYADTYTQASDHKSVARAVEAGLKDGWECIGIAPDTLHDRWWRWLDVRAGDLVIIQVGGRPWHAGLVVTPDRFLHWPPPGRDRKQTFSCIERLDAPMWARRIEGFYRHV